MSATHYSVKQFDKHWWNNTTRITHKIGLWPDYEGLRWNQRDVLRLHGRLDAKKLLFGAGDEEDEDSEGWGDKRARGMRDGEEEEIEMKTSIGEWYLTQLTQN